MYAHIAVMWTRWPRRLYIHPTGIITRDWSRDDGSLAKLIDSSDQLNENQIAEMGRKAKARVAAEYTWNKICGQYEEVFVK